MRRLTAGAALATVVCCAAPVVTRPAAAATQCATSESCVVVKIFDGGRAPLAVVLKQSDLPLDQPQQLYQVRSKPGVDGPATDRDGPGTSIDALLTRAGVPPASATFVTVSVPGQTSDLTSTTHDFDPSPNPEFVNGLVPLFYLVGDAERGGLGYVRPLRADKPNDTNFLEFMQVSHGGALTVEVHLSGALLHPTLSASRTTVNVGQSIRLSASVDSPPAGEALDWTWNLATGDKDLDTGTTPALTTPKFTTPGTYYVQASVRGSNGSSGVSNTVAVTVKSRSKTPSKTPAPKTTGPGRGAGTSKNPIGGPATGSGSRYNGRPGAPPTASGAPGAPTATGSRAISATVGSPAAGSGTTSGTSATGSSSPRTQPFGGELVEGFALIDPAGATSASRSVDAAPAAAAAARAGGQHVRASLAWVGAACILALLLAGAGLERRRSFPGPKRRHT